MGQKLPAEESNIGVIFSYWQRKLVVYAQNNGGSPPSSIHQDSDDC